MNGRMLQGPTGTTILEDGDVGKSGSMAWHGNPTETHQMENKSKRVAPCQVGRSNTESGFDVLELAGEKESATTNSQSESGVRRPYVLCAKGFKLRTP